MRSFAYRDIESVKALQAPKWQFQAYIDQLRHDLLESLNHKQTDRKSLAISLRHCLRFTTWASLKNENLSDKKIVELVMGWIACS